MGHVLLVVLFDELLDQTFLLAIADQSIEYSLFVKMKSFERS